MLMNNLIFQYHIGKEPPYVDTSRESFRAYAERHGLSYLFGETPFMDIEGFKFGPYFEILRMFYDDSFLAYDNILFVDTEVYATKDAPNIFDEVEFEDIAGCNERKIPGSNILPGWHNDKALIKTIKDKFIFHGTDTMPAEQGGTRFRMINTGVLLVSHHALMVGKIYFDDWKEWTKTDDPGFLLNDEPFLNAMFNKYNFDVIEFDEQWNMPPHWFDLKPPKANFYHFSGNGKKNMIEFCKNNP